MMITLYAVGPVTQPCWGETSRYIFYNMLMICSQYAVIMVTMMMKIIILPLNKSGHTANAGSTLLAMLRKWSQYGRNDDER